ncbi:MAG: hypothetical protein ABJN36_13595 [Cyclobacteriaceae bacterium]
MKTKFSITIIAVLLLFSFDSMAQERVKEKDLIGNWKLVIEIDEAFDDAKEELDDDESILGRMILSSVSGFVDDILEEIDIYLEFKKGGEVEVLVDAFGETETEYTKWTIDNKGRLYIEDTEHFSSDHDYWMMKDGILIDVSDDDAGKYVYMVNMDK